jgi:hypothetical protein
MADLDALAARLEAHFDCDLFVLAKTSVSRPVGALLTQYGAVDRKLSCRIRQWKPDVDADTVAGTAANSASWAVTTVRHSDIKVDDRIVVAGKTGNRRFYYTLRVVGVRGPKSAYVADRLACDPIPGKAPEQA